jgi:RNA polymerase sigma-70 factor (ECF subfamily)
MRENQNHSPFVCMVVMRDLAVMQPVRAWEGALSRSVAEAQERVLAASIAGLDRRYRLAGLLLGSASDAEDVTHEAMLRGWRSAKSLRDPAKVDAWLDGILVNLCRDRLRRRRTITFIALPDDAGAPARDPFAAVLDRDEVLRAMHGLDPDQRVVVVLHYWAGLTLEGIAERLDWPVGTVKSRLHHALVRMRVSLGTTRTDTEGAG